MLSLFFRVYTFFVGFLFPAYKSFKAIESEDTADDTLWLTYWVVYCSIMIAESFADYSVFWIPGYRFAKMAFLFWLVSPRMEGAKTLYNHFLKHLLLRIEPVVDKVAASFLAGDYSGAAKELEKNVDLDKMKKMSGEAFGAAMTMGAAMAAPKKD